MFFAFQAIPTGTPFLCLPLWLELNLDRVDNHLQLTFDNGADGWGVACGTFYRAIFEGHGEHHAHTLNDEAYAGINPERGTLNGMDYLLFDVPGFGFVASFYANEYTNDQSDIEGYFATREAALVALKTVSSNPTARLVAASSEVL